MCFTRKTTMFVCVKCFSDEFLCLPFSYILFINAVHLHICYIFSLCFPPREPMSRLRMLELERIVWICVSNSKRQSSRSFEFSSHRHRKVCHLVQARTSTRAPATPDPRFTFFFCGRKNSVYNFNYRAHGLGETLRREKQRRRARKKNLNGQECEKTWQWQNSESKINRWPHKRMHSNYSN